MSDSLDVEAWVAEARQVARRSSRQSLVGPCPSTCEDLAQETLVRALAHPPARVDGQSNVGAWLERICRNLRVDGWRAATRARGAGEQLPSPVAATTGEESLIARERRREVRRALVGLPRPQRRALILRFFGDWSFGRIGARLGLPEATARTRVHRALLALRARMAALRAWIFPSLPGFKPALAALVVLAGQPRALEPAVQSGAASVAPDGAHADGAPRGRRLARTTTPRPANLQPAQATRDQVEPATNANVRAVSEAARRAHATRARAASATAEASSTGPVKRYDFDDDLVDGAVPNPFIDLVVSTAPAPQPSLIELRPHFLPEVIKTLENL